jgi:hypothetical protein
MEKMNIMFKLSFFLLLFVCYTGFSENTPEKILDDNNIKIFIENWKNIENDIFYYNGDYTDDEEYDCDVYENMIELYKQKLGLFLMPSFIPPGMKFDMNINDIIIDYYYILNMDISNFIENIYIKYGLKDGHKIYFVLTIGSALVIMENISENEKNSDNYENEILPLLKKIEMVKIMIHNDDLFLIEKYLLELPDLL